MSLAMFETAPESWTRTTLGQVVERGGGSIQTGPFGSQLHASDYVEVGVPSIMPVNIGDNRLLEDGIARISREDADRLSRHIVRRGDIIYSRRGDVGRRALVRDAEDGWFCGTGCLKVRLGEGVVEPEFASYFLGHPEVRGWIARHAVGITMPNLNTSIMEAVPFLLPPLSEQHAIAAVLRSLDDKIEHNRRTSRALEGLARAMFKAWFVDFEPVHAKAAGATSFPGMPPETFAALPTRFTNSELGPVPEGWEVVDVYALAKVTYGAPFKSKQFNEQGIGKRLIRIRDLQTHLPTVFTPEQHPKGTLVQPGDIVVGMDGEFRLHYWTGPEAWLNQRLCSFAPLPGVPAVFLGESLRAPLDFVERSEAATTVIHLGKYDIDRFELLRPTEPVLAAFGSVTTPILGTIVHLAAESRKLAELRDYLLPKLLSGEVRVGTDNAAEVGVA